MRSAEPCRHAAAAPLRRIHLHVGLLSGGRALRKQRYGAAIWLERGSHHIHSQDEILAAIPGRAATEPACDPSRTRRLRTRRSGRHPFVPVEESFRRDGSAYAKLFYNPYGVDLAMFPYQREPPTDGGPFSLLSIGTWSLQKGCDLLVEAVRKNPGVRLTHVGPIGDLDFPIDDDQFLHVDPAPQPELARFYAAADVFVLASRQDGFGMVLAQALASGLPLICTDRTGGADLAHTPALAARVTVVPHDDVDALAGAIARWRDRWHNGEKLPQLAESDREKLSWAAYACRYNDELLAGVRPDRLGTDMMRASGSASPAGRAQGGDAITQYCDRDHQRFHVLDLARELQALGHHVKFYSYVPRARARRFGLPDECHVPLLPLVLPAVVWQRLMPRLMPRVRERVLFALLNRAVIMRLHPCDVFICMSGIYLESARFAREHYGATIWLASREQPYPVTGRDPGGDPRRERPSPLAIQRELAGYAFADRVVIPSLHVAESFRRDRSSYAKLFYNPYGVDLAMFPPCTKKTPAEAMSLLFVGVWCFRKGCDLLAKAVRNVPGVRLTHVGAVGDLDFPAGDKRFLHLIRRHSPSWLAIMPQPTSSFLPRAKMGSAWCCYRPWQVACH